MSGAEIFGVSDRMGSIEAGKIANLTVIKGDIFAKDKRVTHVFVDGKVFEPKAPPPTPARTGTGPAVAMAGSYNITIEIPGQPLTGTLVLAPQGPVLTGSLQTAYGTAPARDGKVTGNAFDFAATVDYEGQSLDIVVRGTVTGDRVEGTIDSPQGAIPFSGTRIP
jgi:hypothetical protein